MVVVTSDERELVDCPLTYDYGWSLFCQQVSDHFIGLIEEGHYDHGISEIPPLTYMDQLLEAQFDYIETVEEEARNRWPSDPPFHHQPSILL